MKASNNDPSNIQKFQTDLLTLILSKITLLEAKSDMLFALSQDILEQHGVDKKQSFTRGFAAFEKSCKKYEALSKQAVEAIQKGSSLPESGPEDSLENN